MSKRWVLAASMEQFLDWCQRLGLDPADRPVVRLLRSVTSIGHLRNARLVLLPGWEENAAYWPLDRGRALIALCGETAAQSAG